MKVNKISRRAFLLGLGAVSTAALLSACGGSASSSSAASGSAASGSAAAAGSDVFRTLDEIKADGTVNIGVFSDKNPFGYVDENGEYQGYDVYFARRLAEDLGVEANFVSTEAANRIEYLQTGKVDIILANFTVTPERAEEVDFALPYMNVALGVISPDSNVITSLDNWNADDQMIVISGTTAETYLTKEYPDIPLQKYDPTQPPRTRWKTAMALYGPTTTPRSSLLQSRTPATRWASPLWAARIPLPPL